MNILHRNATRNTRFFLVCISILAGIWATSLYSDLLFHTLAELFNVVVAGTIFILAWNFRYFYRDRFLVFIGTAFLFIGLIDLLHILTFPGMAIFQGYDTNTSVQLWVAARYLQGLSLLAAPFFLRRKVNTGWLMAAFSLLTGLALLSIFIWRNFPTAYIEGSGQTPFKIYSEYVISAILAAAIFALVRNRRSIDRRVLGWLVFSILLMIAAELTLTFYGSEINFPIMLGHFFKITAYVMIYKAMIETEAGEIYTDMTRLKATEKALRQREKELQKSEAELRTSEIAAHRGLAELRAIYASSPVGLCFLDTNLRYQAINDMMAEANHLPVAEHIGKTIGEVLPPETTAVLEPWIRHVLSTHEPLLNQEIIREPAFDSRHPTAWLVSIHPVSDPDEQVIGVNCMIQDISGQQRMVEALRSSEQTLKLFIEYAPTAIAMLDRDMRYIAVSRRFLIDYRIADQNILGRSHYEIFPEVPDRWKEIHQRCLSGAIETCAEDPFPRADGTLDWVRWEIHPWYDSDGKVGGLILFTEVITERKRAADELRERDRLLEESERRFRSVVESNMIGVVFSDRATGQVTDANDEYLRIIGHSRAELEAGTINWQTITPPEVLKQELLLHNSVTADVKTGKPYEKEYLLPNGERIPVIIGGSYWDHQHEKIVAFVLDNTERKKVEEELSEAHASLQEYADRLKRSNQDLEQFAFVASHDLQEPLRKIKMFSKSLQRKLDPTLTDETRDHLTRMHNASERMQVMIDGLLQLSRINRRGDKFIPLELTTLLNDVIYDLEARIKSTGGQIILEELPTIEADALQIRQLFQNLIGNALKFHRRGTAPIIKISGTVLESAKNETVKILVEDNGIGIDPQYVENIFEPFYRLHSRAEFEGTGLGLNICKKIVERHQGKISVQSQPGEGSTFIILLPVRQPKENGNQSAGDEASSFSQHTEMPDGV